MTRRVSTAGWDGGSSSDSATAYSEPDYGGSAEIGPDSTPNLPGPPGSRPAHINDLPPELIREVLRLLEDADDRVAFMMVQKRWFELALGVLWMRPNILKLDTVRELADQLRGPAAANAPLIRRLNFAQIAPALTNDLIQPFVQCCNLERLVLAGASGIDESLVCQLVECNRQLHNLDLLDTHVGDTLADTLASSCPELWCLFVGGDLTDRGLRRIAEGCPHLRRLKLAGCPQVTRKGIIFLVLGCPQLSELDLSGLSWAQQQQTPPNLGLVHNSLTNVDVSNILLHLPYLRDLKLDGCRLLDKDAFTPLAGQRFENMRLLSMAMCPELTDHAVVLICGIMPRLRHVVVNKCPLLTDRAAVALASTYGPNLQYVHLGHCPLLTDTSVAYLVDLCPRLHFVDLAGCTNLTNRSVRELAKLPRLRRIGLVKCNQIDDAGILALAERPADENTLERVHLSYCIQISVEAVLALLNSCPRLTHLSLTGVTSFMRSDLTQFCRAMPPDLNQHQQQVFCVYSGQGVYRLRTFLNERLRGQDPPRLPGGLVSVADLEDGANGIDFARLAVRMREVARLAVASDIRIAENER